MVGTTQSCVTIVTCLKYHANLRHDAYQTVSAFQAAEIATRHHKWDPVTVGLRLRPDCADSCNKIREYTAAVIQFSAFSS